jgi:predicted lipoprotein with Yx(FWY)xxD motif
MTLCSFGDDACSLCNGHGDCFECRLPYSGTPSAKPCGPLALIARNDGTRQWANDGMPLYFFVKDANPGSFAL